MKSKRKAEYTALLETRYWDVEILIAKEVKFRETILNSGEGLCSVVTGKRNIFLDVTHQQGIDIGHVGALSTGVNY
jgi:hypothetical protein